MKMRTFLTLLLILNLSVQLTCTVKKKTPSDPLEVTTTAIVDLSQVKTTTASRLLGISFDGRTSGLGGSGANIAASGYYDSTDGSLLPGFSSLWSDFPILGVRYPANAVMKKVDWKLTIGPVANRSAQSVFGTAGPSQVLAFGFNEFMALLESRGLNPSHVQIMLVIYPSTSEPDPAQSAADWVEYANSPNDGSNPGGGTDWAALRATHGHPAPYGIKIWNIGNEPWSPAEYNFDFSLYEPTALPIINAMLAIDPTIKITLPSVGSATSKWNAALLASNAIRGKIYGLSEHYFYSDAVSGGTMPSSVTKLEAILPALIQAAQANGYQVILGDHAHGIPQGAGGSPTGDPDLAMQWLGAVTTMDFLLMLSQTGTIERANFWVYGLTSAVWHPIRKNSDGSYTLMAVGALYKILASVFYDQALLVTTDSPAGSDGNAYAVRAGAFRSTDGSKLSVIAVNRDKLTQHVVSFQGMPHYSLQAAQLLTASGQTADSFSISQTTLDSSGGYVLPPLSILILQYSNP